MARTVVMTVGKDGIGVSVNLKRCSLQTRLELMKALRVALGLSDDEFNLYVAMEWAGIFSEAATIVSCANIEELQAQLREEVDENEG